MDIRRAASGDAPVIASLRRQWRLEQEGVPLDADLDFDDRLAEWFVDQLARGSQAWIAEVESAPVGMLVMFVHERMPAPGRPVSRWGCVGNVFVLAGDRNSGVGSQLLDACTSYADAENFTRLVLSPTERSIPFYSRAGFGTATSLLLRPGPSIAAGRPGAGSS